MLHIKRHESRSGGFLPDFVCNMFPSLGTADVKLQAEFYLYPTSLTNFTQQALQDS